MSIRPFRIAVAAAALLLGGQALAQAARPSPSPWDRARNPNAGQATPPTAPPAAQPPAAQPGQPSAQPAPGSAAQAAQPGATGQPMSEEVWSNLEKLMARNIGAYNLAQVAVGKATTPQVKALAERMSKERAAQGEHLIRFAQERGRTFRNPDVSASQQVISRLQGLQGQEFEREYIRESVRDNQEDEQLLKSLRDSTPGKDSTFKKYLDDLENVMEAELASARDAKKALDSQPRQARTPAKK